MAIPKTLVYRKLISPKNTKNNKLLKTKRKLKRKYKLSGSGFHTAISQLSSQLESEQYV